MSNFRNLQTEECKQLLMEEPVQPLTCPSCVPDLSAPKIDWYLEEEPYFDPRICEYIINFIVPEALPKIQGQTLSQIADRFVRAGTKKLLKHFNKETKEQFLSIGKVSKRETIVDDSGLIHIRIFISAAEFGNIPSKISDPGEEPPSNNTDFVDSFFISDNDVGFYTKFNTVMMALRGYEFSYDFFKIKDGALLIEDSEDRFVVFDAKKFRKSIEKFRDDLKKFIEKNGYSLATSNPLSFFSPKPRASIVTIELNNSDAQKPLKISKVFVEAEGCPPKELLIGLDSFVEKSYNPSAIYFMSRFDEIYSEVVLPQPKEWLDFFGDYVYPPVVVERGDNPENTKVVRSGLECALDVDFGDILENALKDISINAFNLLDFEVNKKACSQEPLDYDPGLKQYFDAKKQREYERVYDKELKRLKKENRKAIEAFDEPLVQGPKENYESFTNRIRENKKRKREFLERLSETAKTEAEKAADATPRQTIGEYSQALMDQYKSAMKARLDQNDSVFEIFERIFNNNDEPDDNETKLDKFINTVGLCGFNEGLQKSMSCLLKQVSYEDVIKAAVKVTLDSLPPDRLSDILLVGLDPIKRVELKKKVATKLNLNSLEDIPWPWEIKQSNTEIERQKAQRDAIEKQYVADLKQQLDNEDPDSIQIFDSEQLNQIVKYSNEKKIDQLDLKPEDFEIINDRTYDVLAEKQANRQINRQQTDASQVLNELGSEYFNLYVESLFEVLRIDDIIELYSQSAFVRLIVDFGKLFVECPTVPLKDLKENKIEKFNLDICNPTTPVVNIKIPTIKFQNPIKIVRKQFKGVLRDTLSSVITSLIKQFLDFLENSLCDLLEVAGRTALRFDKFVTNFPNEFLDTFRKAFCPEASNEDASDLANNILNKAGLGDGTTSAIDCLGGALAGTMSQNEMISLMVDQNPNVNILRRVSNAVQVGCPRMSDLFNSPDRVRDVFNNIRIMIPEEARDNLRDLLSNPADTPVYNTICLTSEELEAWDTLRANFLQSSGLNPEDAANQVEMYNRRAREALEDAIRNLGAGQDQAAADAVQNILDQKPPNPDCDLKEGESNFGSKAIKEPEELVKLQDDISDKIFDVMGDSFNRELSRNPSPFASSLLEKILSDTRGSDYGTHVFFESFSFTTMDYHDSKTSQENKESRLFVKDFLGEDRGYFPATIGQYLKDQLEQGGEYMNDFPIPRPPEKYNFKIDYVDADDNRTKFILYSEGNSSFDYSSLLYSNNEVYLVDQKSTTDPDIQAKVDGYLGVDSTAYRRSIFKLFLEEKLSPLVSSVQIDNDKVFNKTCNKIFNSTMRLSTRDSQGFEFGYEDEDLTEEDITYVGPNGEEPYVDFFNEEQKILGRSKTNNERVYFLNPEEYGGTYTNPPVYIEPKKMKGWMGISKLIAPDEEECDPKTESIIKFSEVKSYINDTRNSIPYDPRIDKPVERCFVEKPFDKILSKNAMAAVDGISRLHVRMKAVEHIIKGLPILLNLKFNNENYDNVFLDVIFQSLLEELRGVDPLGPRKIEKNSYAMIVMEQLAQSFIRQFKGKNLSDEIQTALENIEAFKENFTYLTVQPPSSKQTLEIPRETPEFLLDDKFFAFAFAYNSYGEKIFREDFTLEYSPAPIFVDKEHICKIFALRLALNDVKVIVKEIIKQEIEKIMNSFYDSYVPKIDSLSLNLLTSTDLFFNNRVKSLGSSEYEKRIKSGIFSDSGEAEDVTPVFLQSPWQGSQQDDVAFKIERYVRIIEKEDIENEELAQFLQERPQSDKGVVSLAKMQELINEIAQNNGELNISDVFGNAVLAEDLRSYSGNIGLNYGLRIVMKLPEESFSINRDLTLQDTETSVLEKAYFTNLQNNNTESHDFISIPICHAEVELLDDQLKNIDILNGDNSYDLDCLARKLVETTDFKMLFHFTCPIKAASGMSLNYSVLYFLNSIGVNDGWDEDVNKAFDDSSFSFKETILLCRKYFASFYESTKFLNSENHKAPKLEIPDFFKTLFGGFNFPEINLNKIIPLGGKFNHKVVEKNPFNKNKQECGKETDKFFE